MTQHDDRLPMEQMLAHAREAYDLIHGTTAAELREHRVMQLAVLKLIEIVGEAARRVSPGTQARHRRDPDLAGRGVGRRAPGIDQDLADAGDGGPFPRLCAKIATGSGKTLVMAMAQGRGARAAEPANELLRLGIEANGGRQVEISSCV